ncbi:MAG: proteasome subunit alpha, partial [Marmoricola sp.]
GQVADEQGFAVMGGATDPVTAYLKEHYQPDLSRDDAIRLAVSALGHGEGEPRTIAADDLEVAVLDRTRIQQRKFKRLADSEVVRVLGT